MPTSRRPGFKQRARARTWWSTSIEEGSLGEDTLACLEREGFSLLAMPFRTTAENLAKWFFDQLAELGLPVAQVDVYETPNNCAFYRKDA